MGSVRFEAPAGQIVDLGIIRYSGSEAGVGVAAVITPAVVPYASGMTRPARLDGLPVIPAELRAVDKIPNYLGGLINRHPALPGVLRYERDRVIDDRTGQAPTPQALTRQSACCSRSATSLMKRASSPSASQRASAAIAPSRSLSGSISALA